MVEQILDGLAHANRLSHLDARLKLTLGIGCILVNVFSASIAAPLFICVSFALITVFIARIPAKTYLQLCMIPASFAVISAVIILFLTGGGDVLAQFNILGVMLSVKSDGANLAALVLARTFGGMSALFFIALTTPMTELFSVMHALRLPREFIDLSMLIYRFIFIFIGDAILIYNAQAMRLGYAKYRRSFDSLAMLVSMLFIRAWKSGEQLIAAMDARCYDGKMELLDHSRDLPGAAVVLAAGFLMLCGTLAYMTRNIAPF